MTTSYIGNYPSLHSGQAFEWTGSTSTMVKYYYTGATRIARRVGGSELYYILGDHLGSTSVVADSSGVKFAETRYKPWGEIRYSSETTPTVYTDYTFQGQYSHTDDFGLMYYVARWYDPYLNRFTQPDSIIPDPSNPADWDRYAYTGNNPVNRVDPSGHFDNCSATTSKQCAIDNAWTLGIFKQQITAEYGVSMTESNNREWSLNNLRTAYKAFNMVDSKLNGNLKSMIAGTTFTTTDHPSTEGTYSGQARSTGADFHIDSTDTKLPLINILHETGHLLDMLPATNDVFSGQINGNPDWTRDGYVDREILNNMFLQPVQARPMGEFLI